MQKTAAKFVIILPKQNWSIASLTDGRFDVYEDQMWSISPQVKFPSGPLMRDLKQILHVLATGPVMLMLSTPTGL